MSLNTIVAIYATLLKTAILLVVAQGLGQLKWSWFATGKPKPLQDFVKYDDASRGPIGSLALLWRLRSSNRLSSLAACITILAVATDPFAQQLLRYYECSTPVSGTVASLPRTNEYSGEDALIGPQSVSIVPGIQTAMNTGLFNPNPAPPVDCLTGNCTWYDEYSSVGWCSACEDISNQITITNETFLATNPYSGNLTTSIPGGISTVCPLDGRVGGNGQMAALGLPPTSVTGIIDWDDNPGLIDFLLGATTFGTDNPSTYAPWPDCNSTSANETLWKCKGFGAARCQLSPCVKTFKASVTSGRLIETLVDSSTNWGGMLTATKSHYMLDTECINPIERVFLVREGHKLDPAQRWLGYDPGSNWEWLSNIGELTSANNTYPESMWLRSCIYVHDQRFSSSIIQMFTNTTTGFLTGPSSFGTFQGPQQLQTIYDYGNVNFESVAQNFENISISLTNHVRQNGIINYSIPATGISTQNRTCVAIRWAWLTYPAVLVVSNLCFFVLMVLQTWPSPSVKGQNSPGIFKSNPLPLLYHGLWHSEWTVHDRYDNTTDTADLKAMKALATETKVKFSSSPVGNVARLEVQDFLDT